MQAPDFSDDVAFDLARVYIAAADAVASVTARLEWLQKSLDPYSVDLFIPQLPELVAHLRRMQDATAEAADLARLTQALGERARVERLH